MPVGPCASPFVGIIGGRSRVRKRMHVPLRFRLLTTELLGGAPSRQVDLDRFVASEPFLTVNRGAPHDDQP